MKSLSQREFKEVLKKIETVLTEAGFPKDSVEINFKNTDALKMDVLVAEVNALEGPVTDAFECRGCGGGGTVGVCCSF